jgi:single-stranded DNA-binding protein
MNEYLSKGMLVFVQGRLVVRPYTDKTQVKRVAIEIVASTVQMPEKGKQPPADEAEDDVPV